MKLGPGAAPAAIVVATMAVSFSAIFIRLAEAPTATIVWVRMAMTVVLLSPFALRKAVRRNLPRSRGDLAVLLLSGGCLAAHFLTWTASLRYTSVASSVLLVSIHPVLVAVLGRRLLGERLSPRLRVGIALALIGTAITAGGDLRLSGSALGGDLLAVLGALTFTGYLLVGRSLRARYDAVGYSISVYAIVAVIALVAVPATGAGVLPSPRAALACLGLAAVCTILGHTVFNWSLRHVAAVVVSVAFLGEPPATTLLAVPLLGETPPLSAVAGGAVILAGLALALGERAARPGTERS
jgi:drug/metabolite transporter (DMT)-like permease